MIQETIKKLGFGLMRLPLLQEDDPTSIDMPQFEKMVDQYLAQGFTYFDTAYPYHEEKSEEATRKALVERHPRESFLLADKMPVWLVNEPEDYDRIFAQQLTRCAVEYFDFYLLHCLGDVNYTNSIKHGGFAFMERLKAEGKAKHIGFSFHDTADVLEQILTEHPEMEFVQLQINYLDWENNSIQARKCYEVATRHGKPVIIMEPVKGGSLANIPAAAEQLFREKRPDMSMASWAIRFAASLENVLVVLSGMSNLAQMEDSLSFMGDAFQPVTAEEQAIIDKAAAIIAKSIAIPCTACRYCVDGCPQSIPIPDYFSLFNDQHQFGHFGNHDNYYMNLAKTHGKASDCIACGQCEEHCPQHIEIIEKLKEVASVFEA